MLTTVQMDRAKTLIYQGGRLLERLLFARFFEGGTVEPCLRALRAYQNADGGFGNGIEPDLLCPASSAIGAETALYVLDLLDCRDAETLAPLLEWIAAHQNDEGAIDHPPPNMADYPHQPWWGNPDEGRILALAGFLKKWDVEASALYAGARRYYLSLDPVEKLGFYDYPRFVYLKYCGETDEDRARLQELLAQLPSLLAEQADHFPLFSRYWYHAAADCEESLLQREAEALVAAFEEDGGLPSPYPNLPWWRPIFTLDALVLSRFLANHIKSLYRKRD